MMFHLTRNQWRILDELQNDNEPFEEVDRAVAEIDSNSTPEDTLTELFKLYQMGLVTLNQHPITALKQDFPKKQLHPEMPRDILGDLSEYFEEYRKSRHYLRELKLGKSPAGVPFGIWMQLTPLGQEEANEPEYKIFWPSTEDN